MAEGTKNRRRGEGTKTPINQSKKRKACESFFEKERTGVVHYGVSFN